ncbi:SusC/RagA family TonB-linked outer membrane protein [Roseisolibacter agri]|uniref:SusC/RagA family TonB-linked outer membrane protein n=1 Tax=Roseisolibacter agri TaxID=2014610 RepID=A0AA37QHT4_9BACT|nr:SusC/RagA family TonB-linked outer membrane protein [Roseisolibacter agri]GLC26033.1 SusC/RagA family TonB-linked outer membrane protein [Roseisolibacter agri]
MHRTLVRSLVASAALAGAPAAVYAQAPITVTGRVTVEGGEPLTAAQVFVPAYSVGASTRDDGRYTLTLPARAVGQTVVVTARRIGFQSQSRSIAVTGPSITANFTLTQAAAQLTGVVVSALGIEREKSTLGTAQQQVTNTELTQTKAQNLVNQLQGKVSGVQITGAGTPGGSTNIIIRGQNSLAGNNQPLFVVDGIPVSNASRGGTLGNGYDYGNAISDLNPDDIESLTILKGPNAAALYGSRASNGVVVITTKKGLASDGRMRTEFNSFLQFDKPSILPEWQNQYGQGAGGAFRYVNGAGRGTCDGCDQSWGPKLDGRLIDQFTGPQQPWVAHPDNVDQFFETGRTFSSTLAVSGGTERANARLSLGTDQIKGFVPNNAFRKVSSLLSGNLQVNPRIATTATLQYIRNSAINRVGTGYSNSILEQFFWFGRQVDMSALKDYAQTGRANGGPTSREYNWNYNYHNNPYWIQYENPRRDNRDRFQGSVSATYQIADGISLLARTGSDIYRLEGNQNFSPGYINGTYVNQSYQGGFLSFDDYRNENNSDLILTADRTFLDKLNVQTTLGGNLRREQFNQKSQQTTGLLVSGIYNISNTAVDPTLAQEVTRRQVNGVYGSAAFTWDGWWTVEGTARNDWSSTLPKGENSYFYPSVNTSVVLTDAVPALKDNKWLSFAKIRGGIAQVGADANPYLLATTFTGNSVKFGTLPQYSLGNTLANAQLKPEITRSNEVGLELGLLNGRVTLDGTVYDRYTKNQIFNVTISPASGFTSKAINAGRLSNKGVEALLSVIPIRQQGGLTWTSTFNYGRNRNRVDELTEGVSSITLSQGLFGDIAVENRLGEPAGVIRTYALARDEQGRLITSGGLPVHDDTLSTFGNIQADWIGGWNNTFQWKGFTVNALLDIRRGGKMVSYTNYIGDYSGVLQSSLKGREVDFDNPGITVQGVNENGTPNTTKVTAEEYYQSLFGSLEYYIYDASYTRLREVRVGFDLPNRLASRLNAQSISVALTGRNLAIWKNVPNVDPEFAYNTGNFQGVEYALPSNPRSIGFSLRVTP